MGGQWYPATWQPGVNGASAYEPRGVGVELVGGGPLDGREAHVHDALEALWCALGDGVLMVGSYRGEPAGFPPDWRVLGRYVLDVQCQALRWEPVEREVATAGEVPRSKHPRSRGPFAPRWNSR